MATGDYVTIDVLKDALDVQSEASDARLEQIITAVSRAIDKYTRRRFYTVNETRHYSAHTPSCPQGRSALLTVWNTVYTARPWVSCCLEIDDVVGTVTVATDDAGDGAYSTVWAPTDFKLSPVNAPLDGRPFTELHAIARSFPCRPDAVQVTGDFGYGAEAPDLVREACIIQCARLISRPKSPLGVLGGQEFGTFVRVPRLDPDVRQMLFDYAQPPAVA